MKEEGKHQSEVNGQPSWKSMSPEELCKEYSPSRWSQKHSAAETIPAHVRNTTQASEAAREAVPYRANIRYGTGPRHMMDVYGEDLPKESMVFVYIHGGYWQWDDGAKEISATMVQPLYKEGVVCVIMGYDIAPSATMTNMVEAAEKCLSLTCSLAKERGSQGVVVAGFSAGAQLAAHALSKERGNDALSPSDFSLVRGFVGFSGVYDIRPIVHTPINKPLNLDSDSAWHLSPLRTARRLGETHKPNTLRLLAIVGKDESNEFKRQTREYCQACIDGGVVGEMMEVEGEDHFSLIEELHRSEFSVTRRIIRFIQDCKSDATKITEKKAENGKTQ